MAMLGLGDVMAGSKPHFVPKAKRVIHFFLNGGPSHVDTFDPKPALAKYAGKPVPSHRLTERKTGAAFPSPFKFQRYGKSGIEVSELFEKTAAHIDDIAVIRSMQAQVPNHEPSLMLMNCGDSVQPRPSLGSWLTYGLGSVNENLPGFIAMCPGGMPIKGAENWQSAFLPGAFQGTYVDSKHQEVDRLIENIRSPHADSRVQSRQLEFMRRINEAHRQERGDPRLEARIQSFELAFRMQIEAADAFDVTREPQHIRDLYGDGVHGRQTLIARRLLERGVRMVQLWHGAGQPWDNHDNIETNHRRLAGEIDQPIAALLHDLKQRGMLEDTLVVWGGEFGRTPTVELSGGKSKLGRDHNHYGFSVWMAGGGIKGGTVYGSTDEFGFAAQENPTSVHDLHATILHLLGVNHEELTYRYAGRDFRLTDVHGEVMRPILA
ncbi:MAG: sulfatase [Chthoniobacter sp. 12-60-6]|nr:MAG: sulfatase [Chthoniobacter sp. 12-60-6]